MALPDQFNPKKEDFGDYLERIVRELPAENKLLNNPDEDINPVLAYLKYWTEGGGLPMVACFVRDSKILLRYGLSELKKPKRDSNP